MDVWCGDGGGVRGAYTLGVMQSLQTRPFWPDFKAGLYGGNSVMGICNIALAQNNTIGSLVEIFPTLAKQIFKKRLFGGLWSAKYGNSGKLAAIKSVIKPYCKKGLPWIVTTCPFFQDASFAIMTGNVTMSSQHDDAVGAAMATSAAPSYFPASNGKIDGAVIDNNPIIETVMEAERLDPGAHHRIISIGTGRSFSLVKSKGDWGGLQWAPHIAAAFMNANEIKERHAIRGMLLASRIKFTIARYNSVLPRQILLDDVSAIPELIQWGRAAATSANCTLYGSSFS